MRSLIKYVPEGITLDLSQPDLGHPRGLEIIKRHYKQSSRGNPQYNRDHPAFVCMDHLQGTNPGLYIKRIGGEWWAFHYEGESCPSHRIPAPMSDEHKRQTEYWARAAVDAGWSVELECTLPTRTRPDALIYAPVLTGVEVQRSHMTPVDAVKRTDKAARAGVCDLWFSNNETAPRWAWRVPTVLSRELSIPAERHSWATMPPRRSVTAAGLRIILAKKCTFTDFDRCPYGSRHCGKFHPRPLPWRGLTVDDVAARFPAGDMTALRFWGTRTPRSRHREAVFLVSPADHALYEELTGQPAKPVFLPSAEDATPTGTPGAVKCRNDQPSVTVNTVWTPICAKCGQFPSGPGGILCPSCKAEIEAAQICYHHRA